MTSPDSPADDAARYLRAYDDQLRTDAETPSAIAVEQLGPLRLVTFAGGRGFVTYRDLAGADEPQIRDLVTAALAHYREDPQIHRIEWKARGHDHAPGLHDALVEARFEPQEPESIMIGPLQALATDTPPPPGVTLRTVHAEDEVRAMSAMADIGFGEDPDPARADALVARLARADGMELWVAELDGQMVSAGRLEPVAGTDFAGLWGGVTLPEYRGRGSSHLASAYEPTAANRTTAPGGSCATTPNAASVRTPITG